MSSNSQSSPVQSLPPELELIVTDARRELPAFNTILDNNKRVYLKLSQELEKRAKDITHSGKKCEVAYIGIWTEATVTVGSKLISMFIPLAAEGSPTIQGYENITWNGSQCVYVHEQINLELPTKEDKAAALVLSFSK